MHAAAAIGADRERGASALLAELLPLLDAALLQGRAGVLAVAREVCGGQPAMAPLWNACAVALAAVGQDERFARFRAEVTRAPEALTRVAREVLSLDAAGGRARVLTVSHSGSVARALSALAAGTELQVICGESRPGREGRHLAAALSSSTVPVEVVPDALLTTYLGAGTMVVVGADAIARDAWVNKAGTFGLVAAASFTGVPVYVVASRDKGQAGSLARQAAYSRLFEATPASLMTQLITDSGAVSPEHLAGISERFSQETDALLAALG